MTRFYGIKPHELDLMTIAELEVYREQMHDYLDSLPKD